jgi:hypothetical protein
MYLLFVVYHDKYNFLTNILFNYLISISKWNFRLLFYFLGLELSCSKYQLQKLFFIFGD